MKVKRWNLRIKKIEIIKNKRKNLRKIKNAKGRKFTDQNKGTGKTKCKDIMENKMSKKMKIRKDSQYEGNKDETYEKDRIHQK